MISAKEANKLAKINSKCNKVYNKVEEILREWNERIEIEVSLGNTRALISNFVTEDPFYKKAIQIIKELGYTLITEINAHGPCRGTHRYLVW